MEQTVNLGLVTLLPPIIIIVTALITRRTFEALLLGASIAFIMVDGIGFLYSLLDAMMFQVSDNSWLWLVIALFGSFSALLSQSKGTFSFAEWLSKYANTEKKALILSWLLGVAIFVDDYVNILTISQTMMPITDKHKTPREMISYIIDSTSAPVCVLIPLSTWAVFFASVFDSQPEISNIETGMSAYISAIPYMFYAIIAFAMVPLVILGVIPKVFGMKKAYQRVANGGAVYSERSRKFNNQLETATVYEQSQAKAINFVVPLLVLVITAIYLGDLLPALFIAVVVQTVMYKATRAMSFNDIFEGVVFGASSMMSMIFICIGAFTVKQAMDAIDLPAYIINAVLPYMTPQLFPAIAFIVVAGLAFVTGSCWGIPAVAVPILVPLSVLGGSNLPMTLGAIICGATFGGHACFYSDLTVLTSQASKMENLEHAFSQFPYAMMAAVLSIILFVIFGLTVI